jgi:hypothetical protein
MSFSLLRLVTPVDNLLGSIVKRAREDIREHHALCYAVRDVRRTTGDIMTDALCE